MCTTPRTPRLRDNAENKTIRSIAQCNLICQRTVFHLMTSNWLFFIAFFAVRWLCNDGDVCKRVVCWNVSADSCVITSLTWCTWLTITVAFKSLPINVPMILFYYDCARAKSVCSWSISTTISGNNIQLWMKWWMWMHFHWMRSLFSMEKEEAAEGNVKAFFVYVVLSISFASYKTSLALFLHSLRSLFSIHIDRRFGFCSANWEQFEGNCAPAHMRAHRAYTLYTHTFGIHEMH